MDADGLWDGRKVAGKRRWIEGCGMRMGVMARNARIVVVPYQVSAA
jgi:hypothetical protein